MGVFSSPPTPFFNEIQNSHTISSSTPGVWGVNVPASIVNAFVDLVDEEDKKQDILTSWKTFEIEV